MTCKCLVTVSVLSLGLLLGACAKKDNAQSDSVKEFSFAGGQFKDGKITVSPDFKTEQDPKTKKVSLRRAGGGLGAQIDCICSAGGGGSCFPVTQEPPNGPVIVLCASIDPCSSCDQVITVPDNFTFRATCRSSVRAENR